MSNWWSRPATFQERLIIGVLGFMTVLGLVACAFLTTAWHGLFS